MEIATRSEKFYDDITVDIQSETDEHCIIVISNPKGQILRMMGVNLSEGKNQVHVDNVKNLDAGQYQLSVKNKNSNVLYSSMLTKF